MIGNSCLGYTAVLWHLKREILSYCVSLPVLYVLDIWQIYILSYAFSASAQQRSNLWPSTKELPCWSWYRWIILQALLSDVLLSMKESGIISKAYCIQEKLLNRFIGIVIIIGINCLRRWFMPRYPVIMDVKEIRQELPPICPVHKVGDKIIINNGCPE